MILPFRRHIPATRPEQIAEAYIAGAGDNEILQRFGVTWRHTVWIMFCAVFRRLDRIEQRMRRAA